MSFVIIGLQFEVNIDKIATYLTIFVTTIITVFLKLSQKKSSQNANVYHE